MSDRLAELQRQRALAQEQLTWLDREIAKESGQAPASPAAPAAIPMVPARAAGSPIAVTDAAAARTADEIIAQYQQGPVTTASDVKKGCYLWFILALGMFAIGVIALYFIYGAK